ncbi:MULTISPECIES: PEP phosphonomutase [Streptococcus]|jgi:PEP phosphonomutase-like protein, putative|uniref:PEP phosphonomutase-like protein n=1 Tax=Streptococcus sanguinis TaxID=1305 RepID=A0A2X3VRP4_STRSA|nr:MULTISPECIES: PEP phosphonomutase [Streptococcus]MBF1697835.1 haloacid dehalogenase-like hydrolase [Streptococcus cristatus]EGJ42613.1 PEP phosphonomutase family protein [Streptococcus sanguinis SK1059]EGQ18818.1 PEP phosphonomutase family protein [Streptococcus sanguinis ATCC 29667]EGQ25263.1 PEP phosphonomutase family protein [Streptococcus sanguinis SK340]MBF1721005.1 haloacid dehalogenase-like hydrolase [Streptococcus sp.]
MVKRFISSNASEILSMTAPELKQSIKASEGRVILSENVAFKESYIGDVTNAEIARSFGADLILLNGIDIFQPFVAGLDAKEDFVEELHRLVGRPIGINLEPVDSQAQMAGERLIINEGRQASLATIQRAEELGVDFICLTGNPGTGVTNQAIIDTIRVVKENFSGLLIAGKMHASGVDEPVADLEAIAQFIEAGVDIVLAPAVGSVPGFDEQDLKQIVRLAHQKGALVMSAIGTSQESADEDIVKQMAIRNKICGVDIQHIGDSGYGCLAPVENIFAMSKALRGQRHTISMISRSINR